MTIVFYNIIKIINAKILFINLKGDFEVNPFKRINNI